MASAPATARTARDKRFGARAVLAYLALALVAVPFGLLLFLVEDRWPPLGSSDGFVRAPMWIWSSS